MNKTGPDYTPVNEAQAKMILIEYGVLVPKQYCPACGKSKVLLIRRDKYRCSTCRLEWGLRKGTILEGMRISFRTFLQLIRLYSNDVPANDAAHRLGIAYNTVYEIYERVRRVVLIANEDTNHGRDNRNTGNPGNTGTATNAACRVTCDTAENSPGPGTGVPPGSGVADNLPERLPEKIRQVVFGIRLTGGKVTISSVAYPDSEIIIALPIPTMQRGNILFIDAYGKKYQGFITYLPDRNGQKIISIRARDGLPWSPLGEFWNLAGKSWMAHRGFDRGQIPAFVQELAFRYNHRDTDLFPILLEMIARSKHRP
jgi:transposase